MSNSSNNTAYNDISGISDDTVSKCSSDSAIIPAATAASHPKASYDDVVADYGLFMETLHDLHSSLNSKLLVPTIGGKRLDLHRLFVEVTQRGGFEKVSSERRWRELSSVFSFPSTATNASHLLRKRYVPILQKYEQVYFFRESSKLSPKDESNKRFELSDANIANMHQINSTHQIPNESSNRFGLSDANIANMHQVNSTHQIPKKSKKRFELPDANIANMHQVKSTHQIPKKSKKRFELSDANIANMHQVNSSHQIPNEGNDSFVLSDANIANVYRVNLTQQIPSEQQTSVSTPQKRKRKESDSQTVTGFSMFFVEHYSNMRPLYSGKEKAMIKQINLLWGNLTESEKEVYQATEKARCKNI